MSHYPRRSSYTPGSYLPFSSSSLYSSSSSSYLSVPSYKSRQRSSSYSNIYTPTPSLYQNVSSASTSRTNSHSRLTDSSPKLTSTSSRSNVHESGSYSRRPLISSSSSSKIDYLSSRYAADSSSKDDRSRKTDRPPALSRAASRDYCQLYEDAKKELDTLANEVNQQENQWNEEKKGLQKKIDQMAQGARVLPELEAENKKLKDENKTLLRVLSKLNKDYTYTAQ